MNPYRQGRRPADPGPSSRGRRSQLVSQALAELDESEAAAAESSWTVGYLDVLLLLLTLFAILLGLGFMHKQEPVPAPAQGTRAEPDLSLQLPAAPPPAITLDPRVLLAALQARPAPPVAQPLNSSERPASGEAPTPPAPRPPPAPKPATQVAVAPQSNPSPAVPALERLAQQLATRGGDLLELQLSDKELRLELRNDILFPLGSADLGGAGRTLLERLAELLASQETRISVEGHTDDLPITTKRFPSNWELSLHRASGVARQLIALGVPAERIQASGFADTRPRAANDSPEHRAQNRRVTLVLHLASEALPVSATVPESSAPVWPGGTRI